MTNKKIKKIIDPLIKKKAWNVSLEHDNCITLEFGEPCKFKENGTRIYGEWHLWINRSAWRLERKGEVIAAFADSHDKLEEAIRQLEGLRIQSIDLLNSAFDTIFIFEQEIVLRSFSVYSEEYEHWMLFTPNEHVLVIGPGNYWSHEYTGDWRE